MIKKILIIFLLSSFKFLYTQDALDFDDDFASDSDIFSDFNDDLETSQVMEDERFYRYSRFVSFNIGLGMTTFTGNRGLAYEDNLPSYAFSLAYFIDFQNAFLLGIEFSSHDMNIFTFVQGSPREIIGVVRTNFVRPFIAFRYYVDTRDLGTAITYSNPYFVGRVEYWYQTNEFLSNETIATQSGGGLGTAVGFGFEFPIEIRKTFFNVEFLYHSVNFFDSDSIQYRQIDPEVDPSHPFDEFPSEYGYNDLRGDVWTIFFNYTNSW